ncbi:hypothetical protein T10_9713, partial [Trichinella papuae]
LRCVWPQITHQFALGHIFSMDETGLFCKAQRKRAYVLPDHTRKGSRQSMCSSITGTFKVPLLVIGKSKRPGSFPKNIHEIRMFYWQSNNCML